ncbi:MAG: 7-carboxy-7-deazaguanine synthase QueE [Oscillospiraceae bacterium]|nr:7-carboxy-7-deazaguanine synthase QueE [Oscillospiraceae bacterium]
MYNVVEIFKSLQGEGANTGKEVVFVRFAGCNLACDFCDTKHNDGMNTTAGDILAAALALQCSNVILTGGEPLFRPGIEMLLRELKQHGFWLGLETNGTIDPGETILKLLDYVAVSPKAGAPCLLPGVDEVRIVVTPGMTVATCQKVRDMVPAVRYYLSPCERGGEFNFLDTIRLLGQLNERTEDKWLLSLQTHKLAKIA